MCAAVNAGARKTDFAMSSPIVVTACIIASSESGHPNGDRGIYVPVEEPSTPSGADSLAT
jgi:hypothetical protein